MGVVHEIHVTAASKAVHSYIDAVQNDSGRSLRVCIDDMAVAASNTGRLEFMRADKSTYGLPATPDTSTNSFFISDISQALTQVGVTECQLKVNASSIFTSTYSFNIRVHADITGDPISQSDYRTARAIAEAAAEAAVVDFSPIPSGTIHDIVDGTYT